jgi:hypothetical protein
LETVQTDSLVSESILECISEVSTVESTGAIGNIPATTGDINSVDTGFALASATVVDCNHTVDVGDATSLSL